MVTRSFFPSSSLRRGSMPVTRSLISRAALLVNVTARILAGKIPRLIMCAMRQVITRVLPVPAPARIKTGPFIVATARRCSGLSESRLNIGTRILVQREVVTRRHTRKAAKVIKVIHKPPEASGYSTLQPLRCRQRVGSESFQITLLLVVEESAVQAERAGFWIVAEARRIVRAHLEENAHFELAQAFAAN